MTKTRWRPGLRAAAMAACAAALLLPSSATAAGNPQSMSEIQALSDYVDYCTTPDELLALVPDIALIEHPELVDLIRGTGGSLVAPEGGELQASSLASFVHTGYTIPACPAAGVQLLPGFPPPYGFYSTVPVNNWCLPSGPDNGCSFVPDNGLTFDFRAACRQHDLGYRWVPADRFSVDNRFLVDMGQDCAQRNFASQPFCYTRAAIRYAGVRLFGAFSYGNSERPGYNRPVGPGGVPPLPADTTCLQTSHARVETFGRGTTLPRGVNVALTGVVRKHSRVLFRFRDASNNLLAEHLTYFSRENCVVHHERESFNTSNLPTGTVNVSATFLAWENNQVQNVPVATLQITSGVGSTTCNQPSHAWVATFGGNRVVQGAIVYPTGVVRRHTSILFQFYDAAGNLVANHWTQPARDNCVVHHEPEAFSTAWLPLGIINVTASFVAWETDEWVTVPVNSLEIVPPPPPPTCNPDQQTTCEENGGTWNPTTCRCRFNPCYLAVPDEGGAEERTRSIMICY